MFEYKCTKIYVCVLKGSGKVLEDEITIEIGKYVEDGWELISTGTMEHHESKESECVEFYAMFKRAKESKPTGIDLPKSDVECKNRIFSNRKIMKVINEMIEGNPQLRFGQILSILRITTNDETGSVRDIFYEEPTETLKRMFEYKNSDLD